MKDIYSIDYPIYYIPPYFTLVNRDNEIIAKHKQTFREYILDNKNLAGKTLGIRRLSLDYSNSSIYPMLELKKGTITNIVELIKKGNGLYVDDSGHIFKYKKSGKTKILCFKITKRDIPIESSKVSIFIQKINRFFELPNEYESIIANYARILLFKGDYYLYDLSEVEVPEEIIRI
jgi:hypothetical protein